jgi:hypothetical protein
MSDIRAVGIPAGGIPAGGILENGIQVHSNPIYRFQADDVRQEFHLAATLPAKQQKLMQSPE